MQYLNLYNCLKWARVLECSELSGRRQISAGVYNNTLESLPFSIRSKIGRIKSIDELSTGDKLFQAQGYWPNGIRGDMNGKDNDSYIFGGDIRLSTYPLMKRE